MLYQFDSIIANFAFVQHMIFKIILYSVHAKIDATTGGLMQIMQNEQGHVSGMIAHCGDLTKVSMQYSTIKNSGGIPKLQ